MPKPCFLEQGKEALRVNLEQAPAFKPENRRVDFLSLLIFFNIFKY